MNRVNNWNIYLEIMGVIFYIPCYEYNSLYFIAYHLTKQERIKTLARWTWTIWYRKKSHIRPMSMNWFLLIFRRNGWLILKGDFSERWYFSNAYSQTLRVLKHYTIRIWSKFDILFHDTYQNHTDILVELFFYEIFLDQF